MAFLLTFDQIRFGYDLNAPPLLDSVHLSLKEGIISTILGPNGAGKTTLLFLALGWLKPWSGVVRLAGKPLEKYGRRALGRQIALIPQSEHVPFEYTVLEYVLLGRAPYLPPLGIPTQEDERVAFEALEEVGIAHLFDHSVQALSGGERQLVLVARALAQRPRILLLDEPTSHLDLSNKYRLVQILRKLRERGTSILMTTHEPDLALALSDECILMERGRIFLAGPTVEVVTAEALSRIYRVPIEILQVDGHAQVLWM